MSHASNDSLYSILARLPDCRKARGKLYPLPALLTMTVAAILCGCKTLTAVAQWGRDYNHLLGLLGFTKRTRRPLPLTVRRRVVHHLRRP